MKKMMRTMQARAHVDRARAFFAAGRCLDAGQEIDRAYLAFGKGRRTRGPSWAMLKRLDEKFERVCVRKHPQRRR